VPDPELAHVVFGCGPVGRATIAALIRRGRRVRAVSRGRPSDLPAGVEHVTGDVRGVAKRACEGAEAVYQCLSAPYHRWASDWPPLQAAVVAGAVAAGVPRFVSFENVYAYGLPSAEPFHEGSPARPVAGKGRVRAAMIDELQAVHARGAIAVAHVRASDLFGPAMRASALGDEVFGRAARGQQPRAYADLDAPHTWAFTADAGETLARVGTDPTTFGRVWHVPSEPPRSYREVVAALAAVIGRDLRVSATPKWILRLVGLFAPEAGALVEMGYEFDRPFVVGDALTRRDLGLASTPFAEAVAVTARWFADGRAEPGA